MPNWTDEQLSAINAYGVPVIVSAAAGSGKTAVLVERTIRLLCDEKLAIPANTLLAATFTNDAASQMREKLTEAFENAAIANPESLWIMKQQSLLRLADICTINSFCFDMVKSNLSSTDFQAGIRIMDDAESGMVTERALEAVMENAYASRPDEIEELIAMFCKENDGALRGMVLKLYKFLRSLPFKKLWTDKVLVSLQNGSMINEVFADSAKRSQEECAALKSIAERLLEYTERLPNHSAAAEIFKKNCEYAFLLAELPQDNDYESCRKAFSDFSWLDLKSARQKKAEVAASTQDENDLYEIAKKCYARLKKKALDIGECYKHSREAAEKDAKRTAEAFKKLIRLTDELDSEVRSIKIERNAVDFADTELMTVELLAVCDENGRLKRTPLAEEIYRSHRYGLILIDEFQDVNNLQEVIFKAISDTEDMTSIGNNVFCVGDVKQAIYRFRQANPMIFMNTRFQGQDPESSVREILLTRNFRSRGSVLDFSNYVFSSLMTAELGEVDYNKSEELVRGAQFEGADAPCEIITVHTDAEEESGEAPDEFTAIARKIRRMIDDGVTVRDGDTVRPCRPGDFCVLTRNNILSDALPESFKTEGLKILSSGVSGYLKSREISLVLNLLTVTVSPMRDIPLASVMLSPIMGFTDDEIALVKLHDKKARLYKNILDLSSDESDQLGRKCSEAVKLIKKLRIYSASLPLTRLVKKIYDVTDIFAYAAAYEDGKQKCANLYLLLEYAKSYEASSDDGAAGFLRYIDYISKSGGDFEEALTVVESDDAVNVKTIHKSKGLEYPFVFVCQLSKAFNFRDIYGRMTLNSAYGIGLSFLDYSSLTKQSTAFSDYVAEKNTSELLSEELRLLYVAMTRAKERLFIVLDIGEKTVEKAGEFLSEINSHCVASSLSKRAACPADWLLMALSKHPYFGVIRDKLPFDGYCDPKDISPAIKISGSLPPNGTVNVSDDMQEEASDPELVKRIIENFGRQNDRRLTTTEAKVSVSELAKDDPLSFFPKVPGLDDTVGELTAAKKGTIMHRFMQIADYSLAAGDVEAEIERLKSRGAFTGIEAASISRKSLRAFFGGEIYKRISASKNVMREKSFIVKFSDINVDENLAETYNNTDGMLQGIADCIFEEDDGYVLVDYKTDRVNALEELKERYSMQLALYKAAFDILLDKPVKSCYIYSYRLAAGIEVGLQ